MIHLTGHSALITGSSSGIGRAIATAFAAAGANVVIHGRDDDTGLRETAAECSARGVTVSTIAADLAVPSQGMIDELFNQAVATSPRLDIIVNNAGHFLDLPFEQMTWERFAATMQLNVTTGYFLSQRFARHWIENDVAGRILFTGSINGRLAEPNSTAYDISKGAVEMMVKTLAVALAPKNIRVNGIAPGLVRTGTTKWIDQRPEQANWVARHTPNGQIPSADVCGPAAVFLSSDAAAHIHGQMLLVDGGMSAWQHPKHEA
jgi:NAD(P)-dependent dehydrogenase (short-subunit alcohol dehydrogenase family)